MKSHFISISLSSKIFTPGLVKNDIRITRKN